MDLDRKIISGEMYIQMCVHVWKNKSESGKVQQESISMITYRAKSKNYQFRYNSTKFHFFFACLHDDAVEGTQLY